jgi:hypothetical protein
MLTLMPPDREFPHGLRGRVRRLIESHPDDGASGAVCTREYEYEFDPDGWQHGLPAQAERVREIVDPDGGRRHIATLHSGKAGFARPWLNGICLDAGGAAFAMTTYDAGGRPLHTELQGAGGDIVARIECATDEAGRVVEIAQHFGANHFLQSILAAIKSALPAEERERFPFLLDPGAEFMRIRFEFDPSGHPVEEHVTMPGGLASRTSRRYNRHGDVSSEQRDGHPPSTFSYEYDSRGNWTRRIECWPGGERETRRQIEYWE